MGFLEFGIIQLKEHYTETCIIFFNNIKKIELKAWGNYNLLIMVQIDSY